MSEVCKSINPDEAVAYGAVAKTLEAKAFLLFVSNK